MMGCPDFVTDPNMRPVFCRKCRHGFEPDLQTRGPWICPHCQAKNANLTRHYRGIADLCVLGLVLLGISVALGGLPLELNVGSALIALNVLLLLVTNVAIFKSKTAWTSAITRFLVWAVFVVAFLFSVGLPLTTGRLFIPAIVVYAFVFPYLFWLGRQTNRAIAGPKPATGVGDGTVARNEDS
jgi:hypothetical protein